MNNLSIETSASTLFIKEALYQRVAQVRAITSCLLLAVKDLSPDLLYDAIWAIDSYLEEIDQLQLALDRNKN
jgi:hypothetical protein